MKMKRGRHGMWMVIIMSFEKETGKNIIRGEKGYE